MNKIKTDIHTHIIPDVDDGAYDIETALAVIKDIVNQGINTIFATSHSFAYIDEAESDRTHEAFHSLKKMIQEENIPINLYHGCELLCMKRWMDRLLKGLKTGQYPSMNNSPYVLVEFTTFDLDLEEVNYCINSLLAEGYYPIFAHIERYAHSFASLDFIREMKKKGCLFQVCYNSLWEEESEEIKEFAKEILHYELADFMGSDSHNMKHRPAEIENGLQYIQSNCSQDYITRLLDSNTRLFLLS